LPSGSKFIPEFLQFSWNAGVVRDVSDFAKRIVIYYGVLGESYAENYPVVDLENRTS
jgi:uncharacterized protein YbcV (DUF1398 family)